MLGINSQNYSLLRHSIVNKLWRRLLRISFLFLTLDKFRSQGHEAHAKEELLIRHFIPLKYNTIPHAPSNHKRKISKSKISNYMFDVSTTTKRLALRGLS